MEEIQASESKLPSTEVRVGKVERIKRNGFFDHEPNVVEPCEECGGMHDSDVLTMCALQRAKKLWRDSDFRETPWYTV